MEEIERIRTREPLARSRVSDNSDRQATKLRGRLSDVRVLRAA